MGESAELVPTIQSLSWAARRMAGLQITRVQAPQNGFGAAPLSDGITHEKSVGMGFTKGLCSLKQTNKRLVTGSCLEKRPPGSTARSQLAAGSVAGPLAET
jgi:hypothetical protein